MKKNINAFNLIKDHIPMGVYEYYFTIQTYSKYNINKVKFSYG